MNILQVMKDALDSIGRFTSEEGSTERDFNIMDNLIVAIEEMEKAEPVAWRVWRGNAYELYFSQEMAVRRGECFVPVRLPEPLYTTLEYKP